MSESFADHPVSLGERRAEKTEDCRQWKPRDVLVSLLRDIDSGTQDVRDVIVVYRCPNGDRHRTSYSLSCENDGAIVALGMLSRAAGMMNEAL